MQPIIYEQPLNERIRTFLRLEHLFQQIHAMYQGSTEWDNRAALAGLIEMLNIFDRSDLKTELVKEIDRFILQLSKLQKNYQTDAQIDNSRLQSILEKLSTQSTELQQMSGRMGQALRENELITVVRQRLSIPGGTCNFDLPVYHHWLNQPDTVKHNTFHHWISALNPVEKTIALLLNLIRDSGYTESVIAQNGFFQKVLETHTPCQLVRVSLKTTAVFPEISGSKHRISIRFLFSDHVNRPTQTDQEIPFSLTCCML